MDFSWGMSRWLARRHAGAVSVAWDEVEKPERLAPALSRASPFLPERALADAGVDYVEWLRAGLPPGARDGGLRLPRRPLRGGRGRRRGPGGAVGSARPHDPLDARGVARLPDARAPPRAPLRRRGAARPAPGRLDRAGMPGRRPPDPPARSRAGPRLPRRRAGGRRRPLPRAPRFHVRKPRRRRRRGRGARPRDLVLRPSPGAAPAAPRGVRLPPRAERRPGRLRRRVRARRPARSLVQRLLRVPRRRIGLRLCPNGRVLPGPPRDPRRHRRPVSDREGERRGDRVGSVLVLPEARLSVGRAVPREARPAGGSARGEEARPEDADLDASPPGRRPSPS